MEMTEKLEPGFDYLKAIPDYSVITHFLGKVNAYYDSKKTGKKPDWADTPWGLGNSLKNVTKALKYYIIALLAGDLTKEYRTSLIKTLKKLGVEQDDIKELFNILKYHRDVYDTIKKLVDGPFMADAQATYRSLNEETETELDEKLDSVSDESLCIPDLELMKDLAQAQHFCDLYATEINNNSQKFTYSKAFQGWMPWVIASRLYKTGDQEKFFRVLCTAMLLRWTDLLQQLKRTMKNLRIADKDLQHIKDDVWKPHSQEIMADLKTAKAYCASREWTSSDAAVAKILAESLNEKVEKHDTLNPKLWNDDNTLKPEVAEKINAIVDDFLAGLEKDDIKINVEDIKLVGSNCSYNYNEGSDLDVHIVADTDSLECPDNLYPLLYSAYRSIWNKNHDIEFYGIPVEIFVETSDTKQNESLEDVERLAKEEQDAIDSYDKSIDKADSKEEADLYKHIKDEEEEHQEELNKFAKGEEVDLHEARQQTALTSNGIYSVKNNAWIKEPVTDDIPEVDQEAVDAKVNELIARFNEITGESELKEEALYGLFAIEVDENGKKIGEYADMQGKPVEIGSAAEMKSKIDAYRDSWNANTKGKIYDFKVRFIGNNSF